MAKLKAAVIGAGLIAGKKHLPAYARLSDRVEVVALCDVNADAAGRLAAQHGVRATYADVGEMLAREKPDLVDICTPPRTHVGVALAAMRHGANVLIEKPMAMTVEECDEIVAAAAASHVKVCVAHSDLFYKPFMKAREMVAAGAIGTFRGMRIFLSTPTDYMTSHKDHWAHRLPGGVIGESGPHVVYMTLAFINPVRDVTVTASKLLDFPWSAFEDYRMEFTGDAGVSSAALSYATDQWSARVDILGTAGTLLLDLEALTLVRLERRRLTRVEVARSALSEARQVARALATNAVRSLAGRFRSTHEVLISRFADSIARGTPSPVSAEEGREAVRVLNMTVERLPAQAAAAPGR